MRQPPASALHVLLNSLSADALRQAVLALMLQSGGAAEAAKAGPIASPGAAPPPPAKRPGWTDVAREAAAKANGARRRNAELRRAQRARRAGNGNGHAKPNNGALSPAQAVWRHAIALQPKTPWKIVSRELGAHEAQSLDAYRRGDLPPGVTATAIERFLELPVG